MATFNNGESGLNVRTKINNILQHADGTASTLTFNEAGADVDLRVEGVGQTHALFLNGETSNIGIGTATASSKLTVSGDVSATGISTALTTRDTTTRRLTSPGGGNNGVGGIATTTGAMAITLPVGYTSHMVRFTVKIYDYATNESFEIVVAGYNHTVGPGWVNCSAYIVSSNATDRDFTVRFGFNATSSKCVVYVGELTSLWGYPQVNITDAQIGYTATGIADWSAGWAIGFEATAFQNVTVTLTNVRVGARLTGAGQLTATLTDAGARSDLLRLSSTSTSAGGGGGIIFTTQQADTVNSLGMAAIKGLLVAGTTNTTGDLAFSTRNAVTDTSLTERMRITAAGRVGIGTTTPVTLADINGDSLVRGVSFKNQAAQAVETVAATLTIAELLGGLIQYTGAVANLTLPTGTLIEGGLPASSPTNTSFDFSVINTGSGAATLATATGLTLVGAMAVTNGTSGMFRVRKTATNTFTIYRIG